MTEITAGHHRLAHRENVCEELLLLRASGDGLLHFVRPARLKSNAERLAVAAIGVAARKHLLHDGLQPGIGFNQRVRLFDLLDSQLHVRVDAFG